MVETTDFLKPWVIRDQAFAWRTQTYLMGILNITPDSFSDGGDFFNPNQAIAQAARMVQAGVHVLDVGGQSTRPQATPVSPEQEMARVVPVISALRSRFSTPISIDTTWATVATAAIAAGADIVNDVSGGTYDPEILAVAAQQGTPIILMHLRGTPQIMQQLTQYDDLMGEILAALEICVKRAIAAGIPRHQIAVDPGIGFAKTGPQNLEILRQAAQLRTLGCPVLIGPSRKRFIGEVLDQPDPKQRVWGTAAVCCGAIAAGADILRVHDVPEMAQVCRMADAIWRAK
jgi:dihydropteroate synthase